MKAQRPNKWRKIKEVWKGRDPKLGLWTGPPPPRSKSLGSMLSRMWMTHRMVWEQVMHIFLKKGKEGKGPLEVLSKLSSWEVGSYDRDKWWLQDQDTMNELRDLEQGKGHAIRGGVVRVLPSPPTTRWNPSNFWEKGQTKRSQHQGSRTFEMSF